MSKNIAIVGIGQAGIRIVSLLKNLKQAQGFKLLAFDTDKTTLNESDIDSEDKLLLGEEWRNGRGCGGDILAATRAFGNARPEIEKRLKPFDLIFFVGGLGRGTGSGAMPILASILKKNKLPAIFVLTLPFSMEGPAKSRIAENLLKNEIHECAEVVLTLPNDLLFSKLSSDCTLQEAFTLSNEEVAKSVISLALIFSCGNILPANHADLSEILGHKKHFAAIGIGTSSKRDGIDNRFNLAIERMLMSPLLGGINKIHEADALIISLVGGDSLTAGDSKYVLEKVNALLPATSNVVVNLATDSTFGDSILLGVIAIKFDKTINDEEVLSGSVAGSAVSKKKKILHGVEQQTFDFESDLNARGIMEKTSPIFYNGENLDIPTFQRKKLNIKK